MSLVRMLLALLEPAVVLAVLVGIGVVLVRALRSAAQPQLPPAGRWVAAHHTLAGRTVVTVDLVHGASVVESRRIVELADDDPDYDERFLEAMAAAEQRAALYNST